MQSLFLIFLLFFLSLFNTEEQNSGHTNKFGKASFYHDGLHGKETSNGETYNKDDFTAAHLTYPFNTILLVTNKKNNKSVVVRINDRGPFIRSRVIDLSRASAKKIGMVPFGIVQVKIKELNFLNPVLMGDSLLKEDDVWDCYGNKRSISDTSIFMWKTNNWKHAFYMASCLSLEYKLNSILIKITGSSVNRTYNLVASDIESNKSINDLISKFKSDGFFQSKIIYNIPPKAKLHDDR